MYPICHNVSFSISDLAASSVYVDGKPLADDSSGEEEISCYPWYVEDFNKSYR